MARSINLKMGETFTFRLEPHMKAALSKAAAAENRQPGELLRDLLRGYIDSRERQIFETEARRQCLAINARARDPKSDEAAVIRDLDALFEADEFQSQWKV